MASLSPMKLLLLYATIAVGSTLQHRYAARDCCATLSKLLPGRVSFENSTLYDLSLSSYWAEQEARLHPACIVNALTTDHVSKAISILSPPYQAASVPFAVRAGGHGRSGESNIEGGVVIDLSGLNSVTISHANRTVKIGAGAKWGDVYKVLDPLGLTVPGGRSTDVGVGGLSLAGGISYLAPRVGLTVHQIVGVQMVLASGKVVNTHDRQYADLDKAIRGGSNNFGVATEFEIICTASNGSYGGVIYYPLNTTEQQLQAIHNFTADTGYDENATALLSFGYSNAEAVALNNIVYLSPVTSPPKKLRQFTEIPSLFNTLRAATISELANETAAGSPHGFRQATFTLTFYNDLALMHEVFALWNSTYPPLASIKGLSFSFSLEPLPRAILDKTGNDMLNLQDESEPLILYLLSATWQNSADDDAVYSSALNLLQTTERRAEAMKKLHPFQYIGYADRSQKPLASYGEANMRFMRRVSQKYDPAQVFQRSVPGGFKLHDAVW